MKKPFLGSAFFAVSATLLASPAVADTCTQNSDLTIFPGTSVSCNNLADPNFHFDNRYFRRFSPNSECMEPGGVILNSVTFGIQEAISPTNSQPLNLRIHTISSGASFVFSNFTTQIDVGMSIADQSGTYITHNFTTPILIPAGQDIVMELATPDGTAAGNSLFVGANDLSQSEPSYLSSIECDVFQPTNIANLGFPTSLIMVLDYDGIAIGDTYCGGVVNSEGSVANLYATGSEVASLNNVTLHVTDGVPSEFVFIIGSYGQDSITNPGGGSIIGTLCLGGGSPIARFVDPSSTGTPTGATHTLGSFDALGNYDIAVDIHNVPLSPIAGSNTVVMMGQTFNFQAFYRDTPMAPGTGNFSTGLAIMFQ